MLEMLGMAAVDPQAGLAKDGAYFLFWGRVVLGIVLMTLLNAVLACLQVYLLYKIARRLE